MHMTLAIKFSVCRFARFVLGCPTSVSFYMTLASSSLFVWLISHQPPVLFSQNKSAINNQPTVLFSQNKPAPAISHPPSTIAMHELHILHNS
jgi:hypothetical protein